jgi:hypothetical protein
VFLPVGSLLQIKWLGIGLISFYTAGKMDWLGEWIDQIDRLAGTKGSMNRIRNNTRLFYIFGYHNSHMG